MKIAHYLTILNLLGLHSASSFTSPINTDRGRFLLFGNYKIHPYCVHQKSHQTFRRNHCYKLIHRASYLRSEDRTDSLSPTSSPPCPPTEPTFSTSARSCPKLRRLKDRLWVRETLEDLTYAEFACRVEQQQDKTEKENRASSKPSLAPLIQRKKRAVDFENILGNLERRVGEMCVLSDSKDCPSGQERYRLDGYKTFSTDEGSKSQQKCYVLVDGEGLGSVVYSHEQRDALLL